MDWQARGHGGVCLNLCVSVAKAFIGLYNKFSGEHDLIELTYMIFLKPPFSHQNRGLAIEVYEKGCISVPGSGVAS